MFSEKFSNGRIVIGYLNFTDPLKIIFSICMPHCSTILMLSSFGNHVQTDRQLIYYFWNFVLKSHLIWQLPNRIKSLAGEKKCKWNHLSALKETREKIVNIQKLTDIPIEIVISKHSLQEWKHNGKFKSAVPCFMLLYLLILKNQYRLLIISLHVQRLWTP